VALLAVEGPVADGVGRPYAGELAVLEGLLALLAHHSPVRCPGDEFLDVSDAATEPECIPVLPGDLMSAHREVLLSVDSAGQ
jgi:hypothetical protein